jgi:hypothetical protein
MGIKKQGQKKCDDRPPSNQKARRCWWFIIERKGMYM